MVGNTVPGELGLGLSDAVGDAGPLDTLLEGTVIGTVLVPGILTL